MIRKPGHVVSLAIPPDELNFFDFQRQDIGTSRALRPWIYIYVTFCNANKNFNPVFNLDKSRV